MMVSLAAYCLSDRVISESGLATPSGEVRLSLIGPAQVIIFTSSRTAQALQELAGSVHAPRLITQDHPKL
jgi:uroporphyrinogen-III synthase